MRLDNGGEFEEGIDLRPLRTDGTYDVKSPNSRTDREDRLESSVEEELVMDRDIEMLVPQCHVRVWALANQPYFFQRLQCHRPRSPRGQGHCRRHDPGRSQDCETPDHPIFALRLLLTPVGSSWEMS